MTHIQIKAWAMLNGEKHFIWSIVSHSYRVKARCDDGKLRDIITLEWL